MRCLPALLALTLSATAAVRDLKPFFGNRTGAALLFDLEGNRLAGVWNLPRANTMALQPGSVLKPFTLAAYIEAGLYRKDDRAPEALAYSKNEYFDQLTARMDPADLSRGYARFGLNDKAPTLTLAELQTAARRLVARSQEERLRPVFQGMEEAVEYGTARLAAVAATRVAGKTGTMAGSAMFMGYAPAVKPRYLLVIHLDSGSGGGDAAPFAAKIFADLITGPAPVFDPQSVSVRLFWQSAPSELNLKVGRYPAGTAILANTSKLTAPGPLTVETRAGKFLLTVQVPLEEYVAAVLEGEAAGFRQEASREAMAIAARTYATYFRQRNMRRHAEEGFDFCDTTHCQDARFVAAGRPELHAAVANTTGQLLWFNGQPAATYYHADSGGWLEGAAGAPYLKQRRDPWWLDNAEARWIWRVPAKQLAEALNLARVTENFAVTGREESGRARSMDVFGRPAEAASFRTAVGRALGWNTLPSRLFDVKREGQALVFSGRGRGHGIGMPQNSAENMAAKGKTAAEILAEYYPGTKISAGAASPVWQTVRSGKIALFTTNLEKDKALLAIADKELAMLETLTGMKAEPVIRIYPTREAFRDAGGETGNVQGASRGRNVKLPPGASVATLRHELLHVVLEGNTKAKQPDWFREGLVQALLNEKSEEATRAGALLRDKGKAQTLLFWRNGLP